MTSHRARGQVRHRDHRPDRDPRGDRPGPSTRNRRGPLQKGRSRHGRPKVSSAGATASRLSRWRRSTDALSAYVVRRSGSATCPTTSPDACSRPADSDANYPLDWDEPVTYLRYPPLVVHWRLRGYLSWSEVAYGCRVLFHTVPRWILKRFATALALWPPLRAIRIASTYSGDSGVRDRLSGFNTTPDSGPADRGSSLPMPGFACSHTELSRSSRFHVFGLSPPASTQDEQIEICPA